LEKTLKYKIYLNNKLYKQIKIKKKENKGLLFNFYMLFEI